MVPPARSSWLATRLQPAESRKDVVPAVHPNTIRIKVQNRFKKDADTISGRTS